MSLAIEPPQSAVTNAPKAPFVEDVQKLIDEFKTADKALEPLVSLLSKYKFMEKNLSQKRANLKLKLPEIEENLDAVKFLISKQETGEPVQSHFELSTGIYVNSVIESPKTVSLWLGANVMVEYSFDEALQLLELNKAQAIAMIKQLDEDLAFLRDQMNTTEVMIARVYNWDVKQRKAARQATAAK